MSVLSVSHIQKSFNGKATPVLNDISFSMEKGEVVAIIGASGGGKTTLLRCINFLETIDRGSIEIGGKVAFDSSSIGKVSPEDLREARLKIGLVFQQFNLFPQYTVLKNVTLAPTLLKKWPKDEIDKKARAIIEKMGLTERSSFVPSQLSGGQQQRVAIARALALEPEILCFDEPTSALDPTLIGEVINVIKELKASHTTMLIVTHDMNFAHAVADRVIYMEKGNIEEDAPVEEFFTNPKSAKTRAFLGLSAK